MTTPLHVISVAEKVANQRNHQYVITRDIFIKTWPVDNYWWWGCVSEKVSIRRTVLITDFIFKGRHLLYKHIYGQETQILKDLFLMLPRFQFSHWNDLEFYLPKNLWTWALRAKFHISPQQISVPVCVRFRVLASQGE